MTSKHEITLRITLTDEALIKRIRSISQPDRGRVIQRALKVYFDTVGGREVYAMFSREGQDMDLKETKKKSSNREQSGGLKDILGDY